MYRITTAVVVAAIALFACAPAQAVPLTGTPVGNSFGWTPNSTNLLNYDKQVPGREGQDVPYVLFNSNSVGQVLLDFYNLAPGLAFFEVRIDGVATGATSHPIVPGDTIHSGGIGVQSGEVSLATIFLANQFVDIRLALGGERDWDFDWTRFEVQPVPLPGALALLLGGLAGIGLIGRRRRMAA